MKIKCDKCHNIMQVSRSEAIRVLWYKRKKARILCPACGDAWGEEFQKEGDRIIERCKNLIKKLDEENKK